MEVERPKLVLNKHREVLQENLVKKYFEIIYEKITYIYTSNLFWKILAFILISSIMIYVYKLSLNAYEERMNKLKF